MIISACACCSTARMWQQFQRVLIAPGCRDPKIRNPSLLWKFPIHICRKNRWIWHLFQMWIRYLSALPLYMPTACGWFNISSYWFAEVLSSLKSPQNTERKKKKKSWDTSNRCPNPQVIYAIAWTFRKKWLKNCPSITTWMGFWSQSEFLQL